jgi:hypothetical protein
MIQLLVLHNKSQKKISTNMILIGFLILVLITSCGIDSFDDFLSKQPKVDGSGLESSVIFRPVDTGVVFEPNYLGVEIFYRLYNSLEQAQSDKERFEQNQNKEVIPGSAITSHLLVPGGLNYQKPTANSSDLFIRAGEDITENTIIIIEWDSFSKELKLLIGSKPPIVLHRTGLVSGGGSYSIKPSSGDIDFSGQAASSDTIYIQLYAASSGFNFSSIRSVYSKATYLSTLRLY